MSYDEFRKRIDTMRQILVGAVPNPAAQIDQITYALIYKFMSDIDDRSAALGGKRSYFTNEYERYDWQNLLAPSLGAHERLNLYKEAIEKMSKNPGLPELFRNIYQNAFLPFNNADTLTLFLKEVDKFKHSGADDIGDAYEYLLSITGAQGDVGQFRTPRHIIKFIVDAVNPDKNDRVLDPAVGTAGFLIAAYNHVKGLHDDDSSHLTSDELDKLHKNYRGFDIDPTMVRTARVNMYLHGFKTPDIINHDTLSSEDYWNEKYDVILANPPFMTPKGGIIPHKKFGVSANRAEVLFVDYISSHLKPKGRAGFIVPEGIIFQSGNAYKQLRKNLVENSLYAVISLPAGVFQPYAGVKTSILLLDPEIAKSNDNLLFIKIENDGFSTNAQRRPIAGSQFPEALEIISMFQKTGKLTEKTAKTTAQLVPKSEIAKDKEYNLSGDRYSKAQTVSSEYPIVELGDYIDYVRGLTYSKNDETAGDGIKVLRANNIDLISSSLDLSDIKIVSNTVKTRPNQKLMKGDIFICAASGSKQHVGKVAYIDDDTDFYFGGFMAAIRTKEELNSQFLYYLLRGDNFSNYLDGAISSASINNLNAGIVNQFKIPLPPIEIQKKIVAEIDNKQQAINHAREIIKNLERERAYFDPRPRALREGWPMKKLSEIATLVQRGKATKYGESDIQVIKSGQARGFHEFDFSTKYFAVPDFQPDHRNLQAGDVLINSTGVGTAGRVTVYDGEPKNAVVDSHITIVRLDEKQAMPDYVLNSLAGIYGFEGIEAMATGNGGQIELRLEKIKNLEIPIPPKEIQTQLITAFAEEQKIIQTNRKLIDLMTTKIQSTLAEAWNA